MRTNQGWLGFLLHNPGVTFMETPGNDQTRVFVEWQRTSRHLILGSECGEPHLWIIEAGSLAELTRKLQSLVGKTPLPPLWSLGFHQSRWGYGGHKDLLSLDRKFAQHKIPCSGLWLDLDYMDGYRIFEVSKAQFPKGVADTAAALEKNGRRIVPIIDPGVKREPGYWVYDQGVERGAFCKNQEGADFVGLVWPGETVFPDFSLPEVRAWWAGLSKTFRESGFGAAWVDMNDPSTGPVDPTDMRFGHGSQSHESQRNQYALGMQMATVEGFLQARPDERPFLLSRSGFIGTSKWSAVWTGDNLSNEHYLRQCVPTTLGMAISGIPFNGPDLGGFGGDADDELIIRWFQACMLFPFYRNHSTLDSRNEEPWAYPAKTRKLLAQSVRTRYELLPYIYQLFVEQSESGEAMVRPLIYDFDEPALASVSDQFMVGASLMHCPVLELGKSRRTCVLPGSEPWFDMIGEEWVQPGERTCKAKTGQTPLFLRQGSIVSAERTTPTDNSTHLCSPRLVVAGSPTFEGSAHCQYHADDGLSFGYRRGERSTLQIEVEFSRTRVEVKSVQTQHGFGEIFPEFAVLDDVREVFLNGNQVATEPDVVTWSGKPTRIFKTIF